MDYLTRGKLGKAANVYPLFFYWSRTESLADFVTCPPSAGNRSSIVWKFSRFRVNYSCILSRLPMLQISKTLFFYCHPSNAIMKWTNNFDGIVTVKTRQSRTSLHPNPSTPSRSIRTEDYCCYILQTTLYDTSTRWLTCCIYSGQLFSLVKRLLKSKIQDDTG